VARSADGRWLVERVLPGESSDPHARSPFGAPGVAVREGDEILAVDGRPVDSVYGPWPALAGTHGKPVELTIRPADPSLVPWPPAADSDDEAEAAAEAGADGDSAGAATDPAAAGKAASGDSATKPADAASATPDASAASESSVTGDAPGTPDPSAATESPDASDASDAPDAWATATAESSAAATTASASAPPETSEPGQPAESAEPAEPAEPVYPETRRVVIVPLYDDRRLRYQDWVAGRRQFVRARSDGRVGYLHVPDMMGEGWAHLHRDLRTEMGREALIIDVRGNRGGHTSQLIVEKLARRITGWKVPRRLRPYSYPHDAPRGPLVALADEFAGSDGDIVTAAIRSLGLGPVIGARTWGGVVGIDGHGHELVDGTHITVPRYATWFNDFGWSVENYGVDPDTEVLITPDDWAVGRDPQLEVAVDRALAMLAENPPAPLPDPAAGPDKRRPPLPPRP
jgi:tricorn protease